MIKHIVIWNLSDLSKASLIKQELEALNGQIPEILKLEVGIDFSGTETSGDIVLYSEFASQADLEAYQNHPKHKAVGLIIKEYAVQRKMVDYKIN